MAMNPFTIDTGGQYFSQGVQGLSSAIAQRRAESRQLERQQAIQDEAAKVIEGGNISEMSQFMARNPQFAQAIERAWNFQDQVSKDNAVQSSFRILRGEDPQTVLQERAQFITERGGDPTQTIQALGDTPEQIERGAKLMLAEFGTPAQIAAIESIGTRSGKMDIEREKLDIRREELAARNLERQLAAETNVLKKQELEDKIEERKLKIEDAKKQRAKTISKQQSEVQSTQRLIDDMLSHPGLDNAVGLKSLIPSIPGGQAADYEALMETLKSRQFLNEIHRMEGMGALSNAEGRKVASAAEALTLSQSTKAHREALRRIKEGLATIAQPGTYSSDDSGQMYPEGQTARNPQTGETIVFRGGQWQPM